jgi:hypothetical protein
MAKVLHNIFSIPQTSSQSIEIVHFCTHAIAHTQPQNDAIRRPDLGMGYCPQKMGGTYSRGNGAASHYSLFASSSELPASMDGR